MEEALHSRDPVAIAPIALEEHGYIDEDQAGRLGDIPFRETPYEAVPEYLGITPEADRLRASYYVGADWLREGSLAVTVRPKMEVDYGCMLMTALRFAPSSDYFGKFYGISFDRPEIQASSEVVGLLTPMLIVHYLAVLKELVARGLKHGYLQQEGQLRAKVKGRILHGEHLRKNILSGREERIYCSYQEFSADIPENRLLKRALVFCQRALADTPLQGEPGLLRQFAQFNHAFAQVSDHVELLEVKHTGRNKLYRHYTQAINLARSILRRFDYSLSKSTQLLDRTPPFWIDMSRLYEVYVYSKLHEAFGEKILFQVAGYYRTAADFVKADEQIIIDTKYKPHYNWGNSSMVDDIRAMSAYARDTKILGEAGISLDKQPRCLIIYPFLTPQESDVQTDETEGEYVLENHSFDPKDFADGRELLGEDAPVKRISSFVGFYKMAIPLPMRSDAYQRIPAL